MLYAESISGTCGDSLTWSFDTEDGNLHVSGSGDMYNWDFNSLAPWSDYKEDIIHVILESGVTSIGSEAFNYCGNLQSVVIPNTVTSIGDRAFNYCSNINDIQFPNSITFCGEEVFSAKAPWYSNQNYWENNQLYIGRCLYQSNGTYTIKEGTTMICNGVFEYSYMTTIVIPNSVEHIGNYAFNCCRQLREITIGSGIKYIGYNAFYNCQAMEKVYIVDLASWCGIKFRSMGSPINGSSYSDPEIYVNGEKIYDLVIPDGVQNISADAFSTWNQITSVTIPKSVKAIGLGAFSSCKNLSNVFLSDSLKTIDKWAFGSCKSLTEITIPESVQEIGYNAFGECTNLQSVKLKCKTPPTIIRGESYNVFPKQITMYVPTCSRQIYKTHEHWKNYHILASCAIPQEGIAFPTSRLIIFGDNEEDYNYIVSCGIVEGTENSGNTLEYINLEPNRNYENVSMYVTATDGYTDTIAYSFTTTALELITQPSKPVSSTTAILLANTNMADIETSCGFEWKRNDAPADMDGTKAYCPVANGTMAGRLKGFNENTYYKYRAFYQSSAGNMYYGDWQYIFTGDNIVEFEPILYTYEAVSVKENEATLKGYALAGSDDFTEQGFEYWVESRVQQEGRMSRRVSAALGEHKTVTASGISMKATLTGLDAGTVYKYRTYAKLGNQTIYGSEMSFTTKGEYTGSEDINNIPCIPVVSSRKILRNGQILILR